MNPPRQRSDGRQRDGRDTIEYTLDVVSQDEESEDQNEKHCATDDRHSAGHGIGKRDPSATDVNGCRDTSVCKRLATGSLLTRIENYFRRP